MRIRISLFCILCLLLGACSNEEMIPSTSEGGEECAFQFLLRVPGTIDVETKAGTEPKILKLGDTKILQKSGIQKNEVIELIYRGFI